MRQTEPFRAAPWRRRLLPACLAAAALLSACGGGKDDPPAAAADPNAAAEVALQQSSSRYVAPTTDPDAFRLANQASFGPTEALVAEIARKGREAWVYEQLQRDVSRYTLGGDASVHQVTTRQEFCATAAQVNNNKCWRDYFSADPLVWGFYRNAALNADQLRQRMALAMQQIVVVSAESISGTYGLRLYHNNLLGLAFTNWRDVLRAVTLSPVMGDYLNSVNNDKAAPNENYARELLQLFSLGPCRLQSNGQLSGSGCQPVYDNTMVRNYAYALTGWTYPAGGTNGGWGCPRNLNCRFYGGEMVPAASFHDTTARSLLSGISVPAGSTPAAALDAVLDSLMAHPNMAPFIGKQLIQHLVTSNPSPAYVQRVAQAFTNGRYTARPGSGAEVSSFEIGSGRNGDLSATVAAILLDEEARRTTPQASDGKLREPVLFMAGVLRALGGQTDGYVFNWQGQLMQQHLFYPPSVFNFYPPDYPVAGTALLGPTFGVHNAGTSFSRLNFLSWLIEWGESTPETSIPALPDGSRGTRLNLAAFETSADDAGALVDRLARLATGSTLPATPRQAVIAAISGYNATTRPSDWKTLRVKVAAWLVFASPAYQVMR